MRSCQNAAAYIALALMILFSGSAMADPINPDGNRFIPAVDLEGTYIPQYLSLQYTQGFGHETVDVGPYGEPSGGLRVPLASYLSVDFSGSYSAANLSFNFDPGYFFPATTEEIYSYGYAYGFKLFPGGFLGAYPGHWGEDSGPYGPYWIPNVSVAYGTSHAYALQNSYALASTYFQDSEIILVGMDIPFPWNSLLSLDYSQVIEDQTENVFQGMKYFYYQHNENPIFQTGIRVPLNYLGFHGKPDFSTRANPDGWIGEPIFGYLHTFEAPTAAVDSIEVQVPCSTFLTASIGAEYSYFLNPVNQSVLNSSSTEGSQESYSIGLSFYP